MRSLFSVCPSRSPRAAKGESGLRKQASQQGTITVPSRRPISEFRSTSGTQDRSKFKRESTDLTVLRTRIDERRSCTSCDKATQRLYPGSLASQPAWPPSTTQAYDTSTEVLHFGHHGPCKPSTKSILDTLEIHACKISRRRSVLLVQKG